ncbi:hypothetical protein M2451_001437 [Dysgonomonas sp. PFB1-18]|uniref:DUF4099 domain-containing protein n=1 Tax=unclassified Dysgonomonas TaxID=2630389 RepID=UPI002476A83D|nr:MULTISPECIES: DUF4099 domain-containing protein [unclassified Dysgonomonas]MDH6308871.1 hypothetical protein [Dysgonomonas sp. PF1-14]MDH6338433.1 hypothetical protein [Dysgonomonas sp. PF1-16]MDH6380120.1 hypothetical protein [Dysgonomonas sp. PFB1-18]MDH6397261.1 hypothetical protein [Dysgonomonas sp. PF1-23]
MTKTDNENKPFDISAINWEELAQIGIHKEKLEESGELETLLSGEETGIIPLQLVLLGMDVDMDATLQLVEGTDSPILEIKGIKPVSLN